MFLSFLNKKIISIDIGSYETKIIEAKKNNNNIHISKAFSILTPEGSYEDGYIKNEKILKEALKEGFKKNKISSKVLYLTIKSTAIITREIPFPVLDPTEIESMLKFQFEDYLPTDSSRYVIQHKITGKILDEGIERLNVLVIAVPKDIVDSHYFLLNELNLKPVILDHQSNSISKLIRFTKRINENRITLNNTIVTLDLGYKNTNISIIRNGKLQTSKVIEVGGSDLDTSILKLFTLSKKELFEKKNKIEDVSINDEGYSEHNRIINVVKTTIERIIIEVDKIVKYYNSKEIENEIDMIFLYGGLSKIKGIDKLFSSYFNIYAATIYNISKVNVQADPNKYLNCISSILRDEKVWNT